MNQELAKTLTAALVQFIDKQRPEGSPCCSNGECESLEYHIRNNHFDDMEAFIQKKLTELTEFEEFMDGVVDDTIRETYSEDGFKDICKDALNLAKKELARRDEVITLNKLPPYDKGFQDGKAEAMAALERTYFCNPDKLPKWLKNELGKKHLDGYCMGREDTLREMKDFVESHFNTKKAKEGEDLTDLYYKEYERNPKPIPVGYSTNSGTSTAAMHGNTSATDGKPHNPSFTD